jgi:hypothetical protein
LANRNKQALLEGETVDLRFTDDMLNVLEYEPVEEEGEAKQREAKWLQGESDDEEEEDFEWLEQLEPA